MKLYIRDPNTMLECKISILHPGTQKEGGASGPHTWWDRLEASALCEDRTRFYEICEETVADFGGQLCPGFWDMNRDEYIEFEDES